MLKFHKTLCFFLEWLKTFFNVKSLEAGESCRNPLRDEYFRVKDKDFCLKLSRWKQI